MTELTAPAIEYRSKIRLDKIPRYLQEQPNWVFYTLPNKVPIKISAVHRGWPAEGWNARLEGDAAKAGARINDPSTWGLFEDLSSLWHSITSPKIAGPSCALVKELGIVVIDLDDPERKLKELRRNGQIKQLEEGQEGSQYSIEERIEKMLVDARKSQSEVLDIFRGHYIEKSSSGKGHHIFVVGAMPQGYERCKFGFHSSVFTSGQFIHMTGDIIDDCTGELYSGQDAIDRFVNKFAGTWGQVFG